MMPSHVLLCEGEHFGLGSASALLPRTEYKLTTGAYANPPLPMLHASRVSVGAALGRSWQETCPCMAPDHRRRYIQGEMLFLYP